MHSPTVGVDFTRSFRADLQRQSQMSRFTTWVWLITLLPPLLIMTGIALQPWVLPGDLLRDPLAVAEMKETCCKVYYGAISNAGVLLWASGAAVCVFAAGVLATIGQKIGHQLFLLSAGLLTGLLVVDDMFLVHDHVLPVLGVPQPVTYGAYAIMCMAYLLVSWRQILQNRYGLLAVAITLLSISVTIDWFFHSDHPVRILLEDGAKLGGIFAWTAFHVTAAWQAITQKLEVA